MSWSRRWFIFTLLVFAPWTGFPAPGSSTGGGDDRPSARLLESRGSASAPRRQGCTEGSRHVNFVVGYDASGKPITETRTCRNGTFMNEEEARAYWEAIARTKRRCAEGDIRVVENRFGSELYEETLKCVGGRYRVVGRKFIQSE